MRKIIFALLCIMPYSASIIAQESLVSIPLEEQIKESIQIVEGKVIDKNSFWDSKRLNIYTINTIEVYKVFKGQNANILEVVTLGGLVDGEGVIVTPSLQLTKGQIGIFMLDAGKVEFEHSKSTKFNPYSGMQGFYKYDFVSNTVMNLFYGKSNISSFYPEIENLTKRKKQIIKPVNFNNLMSRFEVSNNRTSSAITTFSPSNISAGTDAVLTISGSGFGILGPNSTVEFRNANSGGSSGGFPDYVQALSSDIVSWTDTQIEIQLPSLAGTGDFRVLPNTGGFFVSATDLQVDFSNINFITDLGGGDVSLRTQHVDDNGLGGYTWNMNTEFDNNAPAKASITRAFNGWRCETDVNWDFGVVSNVDVTSGDGVNIIRFDNGSELQAGVLGVCFSYFALCSDNIYVSELDIVFNDTENWQYGPALAVSPQYDFETVAVHELGHGHQLGHVISTSQIMHYALGAGDNNRDLSVNDITGGGFIQTNSTTDQVCSQPLMTNYSCFGLSTDDFVLSNAIEVFPNPTSNNIFINNTKRLEVEDLLVYDLNGKLIFTKEVKSDKGQIALNVSSLASGMYFLKVSTQEGNITKKIVLK